MKKPRVVRPIKFKLDAYRYFVAGCTAKFAFELAGKINVVPLSGCMTDYASSYMSDDIKNFLRKKIAGGDQEVLSYFNEYQLSLNF